MKSCVQALATWAWVLAGMVVTVAGADCKEEKATGQRAVQTAGSASPGEDRVEVSREGDGSVIHVYRVRGIGGVEVRPPPAGPRLVMFRFHGFPALESLNARSRNGELVCASMRPERGAARTVCRFGADEVDAIRVSADAIEVQLPAPLFAAPGDSVEVRWVDQWR